MAREVSSKSESIANLGFEQKQWLAANKLRNNMDTAEYMPIVLRLIFLKYISDSFEVHDAPLLAGESNYPGADPEDPDEYKAENIFWVPQDARWSHFLGSAKLKSKQGRERRHGHCRRKQHGQPKVEFNQVVLTDTTNHRWQLR